MAKESDQQKELPDAGEFDLAEWSRMMIDLGERSQKLVQAFWANVADADKSHPDTGPFNPDPFNIARAFTNMSQSLLANPEAVIQAQNELWHEYFSLWRNTTQRLLGQESESVIEPAPLDRRFKDEAWSESALFDFIKQSYLLIARFMYDSVTGTEGLDASESQKVDFYTRQFLDAMAPTNFLPTNPAVLRETLDSKGENLIRGLENLLGDLERGKGKLKVSMTDSTAFAVGENIATTPGEVIYQNDLMQLIQYHPGTKKVHQTPLLIIPPWINKYYILDLKPGSSFIKWATDQGHSVFVISWVNPDEKLRDKNFVDYMKEGPLAALEKIEKQTGEKQSNVIGYCLGGTLLAATLAYLSKKKKKSPVRSATYFTTMIDFEEAGELSVFVDARQLEKIEKSMQRRGYLDGAEMATTFNMLRANDLIWSFVVNNYLLGKQPFPFDLLYWNSDSTRMPATMHSFYLRNMYLENNLVKPGKITLADVDINLARIKTPSFILSTKEDHIAPWAATYKACSIYSGPVKFVLAGSGHIAGVINPPADKMKYGYHTNATLPADPQDWLDSAEYSPGSWWPEWQKWIGDYTGGMVEQRNPKSGRLPSLEPAPGQYVKVRADI